MKYYDLFRGFSWVILITLILHSCSKDSATDMPPVVNQPFFGFNAKGSTNTIEQVTLADNFLNELPQDKKSNLVIRVTGGTLSQTTYASDWSDQMIIAWVQLQQKHKFNMVFVLNGNDLPANQANLIQRWLDKGAGFAFLEMMNETYLPKYANGDTAQHPEVTEKITATKYADTILPAFWHVLDQFNLPYYLCFARNNTTNPQQQVLMDQWNNTLLAAINGKYISRNIHATLHLYTTPQMQAFDYNQIKALRENLPEGRHIAITEAGVIDDVLSNAALGELAINHYKKILSCLRKGDWLLDQVLYAPYPDNNTANLSSVHGITQKGQRMLEFINNGFQ